MLGVSTGIDWGRTPSAHLSTLTERLPCRCGKLPSTTDNHGNNDAQPAHEPGSTNSYAALAVFAQVMRVALGSKPEASMQTWRKLDTHNWSNIKLIECCAATISLRKMMGKELQQNNFETLQFKSKDGLRITADYYSVDHPKGLILLCHRSHCNRGEYRETAPKLNKSGFSCLAVDQQRIF